MVDDNTSLSHRPLAAIDIGSNSFRLEIGQLLHGRYRRIDYLKETVRLGGGLDANGHLGEDAAQRGLACLARFARRLAGFAPQQVRAVATQTLREARNRDDFLLRAEQVVGFPIEVISGREEARLIYAGVARLQPSEAPRLVIDIGGRSTELILGVGVAPLAVESFPVGSVSLSMKYFADGRLTETAFRAAQIAAGAEFEEALQTFAPEHWREALGSSGTAGAVSQLLAAEGVTDGTITPEALAWCIERCLQAGHIDRLGFAGMRDDRRAVIGGGLSILYTLCAHFGITQLRPAKGALRQGVIIELDGRLGALRKANATDVRDASAIELQRRFGVDVAQAGRVSDCALSLYAQTPAGTDDRADRADRAEARRELGWAAELHEIGMQVSHHDHHRHSAYLMAHVDAAGFSQSQQRRVSQLLLGQRGGLKKLGESLAEPGFAWQLMCLRLAVIACHARGPAAPIGLQSARDGRSANVLFKGNGPQGLGPRTLHLLQQEAEAWQRGGGLGMVLVER